MSGTCEDVSHYSKAFNSILLLRADLIRPELNRSCTALPWIELHAITWCVRMTAILHMYIVASRLGSPRVASHMVIDGTSKRYIKHLIEQLNVD